MSGYREENVRLRIQTLSDLPNVHDQLEELIRLNKLILEQSHQNALSARVDSAMQVTAIGGITDALKSQKKASDDAGNAASENAKKTNAELERLNAGVRNFATLVGTAFAFDKVKQFGLDIIDAKTTIDSLKISLDVMLGSKKESAELYADIVKLAKTTPFSLEEVAEQVVKLKAYNIATGDLIPTVTALGNIAAAVGKEKLPQLTLAYGQVATNGRLMLTELRQFSEAGVPLIDLISVAYGKTKDEVQKMADAHEISFGMVRKAIMAASEDGGKYAGLMEKISKTVGGEVSNLSDSFTTAKARIGDFFEDTIRSGTRQLNGLIDAVAGSNSAISRSIDIVKAVATAFVTYQVATRATAVSSTALAAIEATRQVIYGAYLLLMREVTKQQIVYTASQQAATVAAAEFGAVLAANPIGAVAAVLGALVTAYYAYSAVTDEVTSKLGEEEVQLKSQQSALNALGNAALNAAMGTKERAEYIDRLKSKYPEYFAGINSEKINNTQLKEILDKVNASYMTRISLARQAYKLEGLQEELKKNLQQEAEILATLPVDLQAKYGGSINRAVADLFANPKIFDKINTDWKGQLGFGDFSFDEAKKVSDNLDRIGKKMAEVDGDINKSQTSRIKAAADAEDARWKAQSSELQKGSAAYKTAEAAHLLELSKINGTYREKEYKDTVTHEEKKKQVTLLSEKEIAVIKKQNDDNEQLSRLDQLKQQVDFLNKKEAEEIQSIVRTTIARKTSEAEMVRLREQARQQVAAVDAKYDRERAAIYLQIEAENQKIFLEKAQDTQDKIKVLTEKRLAAEAILAKVNAAKTEEERLAIIKEYDGKIGLEIQNAATEELKVQRDKSEKKLALVKAEKGEVSKEYRAAYDQFLKDDLAYNTALTKQTVDGAKDRVKSIKDYEEEIRKSKKETAEMEQDAAESQKKMLKDLNSFLGQIGGQQSGIFGALAGGIGIALEHLQGLNGEAISAAQNTLDAAKKNLDEVKGMYDSASGEGAAAIADAEANVAKAEAGLAKAKELSFTSVLAIAGAIYQIFTAIADAYNKMMSETYKAIADSYGKVIEAFRTINDEVARLNRQALDAQLQDTSLSFEQRKQLIDTYYTNAAEQARGQDQLTAMLDFNQKAAQIAADSGTNIGKFAEGMTRLYQEQEAARYQIAIRDAQQQVEQAALVRDAKIAFLGEELDAFRAAKQKESEVAAEALEKDRKAAVIFYSDKQLRAQEDDVFRAELLKQGEAREVAALEAAKQREITRAQEKGASAEEVARIVTAFDKLIADKHAEYQDAQGTKTKEVSLANREVKSQEADKIESLELTTANKIKAINIEIANMQARTEYERKLAQQDYAEAKERSERAIFENTKAMQVAQLQGEQAILRAKRNIFNAGAIDNAVGQLGEAINNINNLAYQSSTAPVGNIFAPGSIGLAPLFASIAYGLTSIPYTPIRADNKEKITSAYDKDGNFLQITYNGTGKKITVFDKQGKPFDVLFADGYVPVTGEKFAKGTESVEGKGYMDGIDTVPAWLTKGERVFTVDHNKLMAGLSNEQVVDRVVNYDRLAAQFPQLLDPARWSDLARTTIALPPGILNATGGKTIDVDGLRQDLKSVKKAIENQKTFSVNIDKTGFSTALLSTQGKTTYIQNLLNH